MLPLSMALSGPENSFTDDFSFSIVVAWFEMNLIDLL